MSNLTTVYIGTDEKCPKCERNGREDPSELTYVVGLVEPGVYQLICPQHGSLGEC